MTFSFCHIVLSVLFLVLPFSSAAFPGHDHFSLSSISGLKAEKLIRDLNLFPNDDVNIVTHDPSSQPSKIVEKIFKFPFISDSSSGPSVQELGHHAGYYRLPRSHSARMFYLFFESRNSKSDPVVIWLTGGPGCSSELAVFYENGPFQISNNLSLVWNDYGWDKAANLLFVDQPIGTGFSYTSNESDIRHNEEDVSNDLFDFLQAFFNEHPQYVKNDFYITGESYAGHYIPAIASRVNKANKAKEGIHINFKGFAIGNGLTNPEIQYEAYSDYALNNGLITKADYENVQKLIPDCKQAVKSCGPSSEDACVNAYGLCNQIFNDIINLAGGNINYYDIRKKCKGSLCYDFSNVERFLNEKSVRDALGVGDIDFVSCSTTVYYAMESDFMRNFEVGIPELLEDGIKVLVYAGEYDLMCNWLGNSRWVNAMEWSGQKQFVNSPNVSFLVDGTVAGQLKSYGPLSFLKVHNAGHLVPMDQPKAALQMLNSWMQGKLATGETPARIPPRKLTGIRKREDKKKSLKYYYTANVVD